MGSGTEDTKIFKPRTAFQLYFVIVGVYATRPRPIVEEVRKMKSDLARGHFGICEGNSEVWMANLWIWDPTFLEALVKLILYSFCLHFGKTQQNVIPKGIILRERPTVIQLCSLSKVFAAWNKLVNEDHASEVTLMFASTFR